MVQSKSEPSNVTRVHAPPPTSVSFTPRGNVPALGGPCKEWKAWPLGRHGRFQRGRQTDWRVFREYQSNPPGLSQILSFGSSCRHWPLAGTRCLQDLDVRLPRHFTERILTSSRRWESKLTHKHIEELGEDLAREEHARSDRNNVDQGGEDISDRAGRAEWDFQVASIIAGGLLEIGVSGLELVCARTELWHVLKPYLDLQALSRGVIRPNRAPGAIIDSLSSPVPPDSFEGQIEPMVPSQGERACHGTMRIVLTLTGSITGQSRQPTVG